MIERVDQAALVIGLLSTAVAVVSGLLAARGREGVARVQMRFRLRDGRSVTIEGTDPLAVAKEADAVLHEPSETAP